MHDSRRELLAEMIDLRETLDVKIGMDHREVKRLNRRIAWHAFMIAIGSDYYG